MTVTKQISFGSVALGAVLLISLSGWAGAGMFRRIPKDWKESCLDCLTGSLGSKKVTIRRCAVWALGGFGPAGEKALPPLQCALYYDPDRTVRRLAHTAICRIAPGSLPPFEKMDLGE